MVGTSALLVPCLFLVKAFVFGNKVNDSRIFFSSISTLLVWWGTRNGRVPFFTNGTWLGTRFFFQGGPRREVRSKNWGRINPLHRTEETEFLTGQINHYFTNSFWYDKFISSFDLFRAKNEKVSFLWKCPSKLAKEKILY